MTDSMTSWLKLQLHILAARGQCLVTFGGLREQGVWKQYYITWPTETGVLVKSLLTGSSMLARVRRTLRNVLLTEVPSKPGSTALTLIAEIHTDGVRLYHMTII